MSLASSVTSRSNCASRVGRQRRPFLDRAVELRALRRIGPALEIGEGRLVRRDHAAARAGLDRHIAQRQPPFDRQRPDRRAGEFDGVAGRAVGADMGDDRQHDVLGRNAGRCDAIDGDAHARRLLLPDRLRHQHMRHFGGADAEGVGAERAVGRGVAVAADDQQARQGQALLGADDMHDALPGIVQAEQLDAVLRGILLDLAHHPRQLGIGDVAPRAARRHVMVGDAEGQAGLGDRDARAPPACRRRGTSPHERSGGRPRAATGRPRGRRSHGRPRACRSGFAAGS